MPLESANIFLKKPCKKNSSFARLTELERQLKFGQMKFFTIFLAAAAAVLAACSTANLSEADNPQAADSGPSAAEFKNPPDTVRPWCYWWWVNGNVDRDTISKDLAGMKKLGFGGFLLFDARGYWEDSRHLFYPKPKCEFMDETWRENFAFAMKEASRLGLEASANLSNCAGRFKGPWKVGADAPKRLICKISPLGKGKVKLSSEKPADRKYFWDVARFAVRHDGQKFPEGGGWLNAGDGLYSMEATSGKRTDNAGVTGRRNAIEIVDISGAKEWEAPNGGQWADVRFAYTTFDGHDYDVDVLDPDAVARHYGRMAGELKKDLGGLFGKTLTHFYTMSWEGAVPTWSPNFAADFKKFAGYDIKKWLPVLAGFRIGGKEASDKFMTDFRRARNETFRANYYENLAARAHADGLGWHSESGGPWIRTAPVFGEADQLEFLSDNDMPQGEFWVGTQFGGEKGRCGRYLVKPIANTANIYGKDRVAVEAFTHMNRHWSSYPALLKITADSAFADGANMIIWHTYTASPEKFGKPGIEYFAGTHINGNVTWHNMAAPFIEYLARCQYMLTRGKSVSDVCVYTGDTPYQHWGEWKDKPFKNSRLKIPAGFSYDIANNDVLLNRAKVENGRLDFGAGKTYSALIVDLESPLVSAKALEKILELKKAGLPVAAAGNPPAGCAGLGENSDKAAKLGRELFASAKSPEEIFASLKPAVDTKFAFAHRRAGGADIYFLTGSGIGKAVFANSGIPTIWNPLDGSITEPKSAKKTADGRAEVELDLGERGAVFAVFGSGVKPDGKAPGEAREIAEIATPWEVEFERGMGAPEKAVFEKLAPWNESSDKGIKYFSGTAAYKNSFELPKGLVGKKLSIGLGKVGVAAQVFVNGQYCGTAWAPPFEVDISKAAKEGKNSLEIKVANTWENRLIGDAALPEGQRFTKSNMRLYKGKRTNTVYSGFASEEKLSESGLLGPVKLIRRD